MDVVKTYIEGLDVPQSYIALLSVQSLKSALHSYSYELVQLLIAQMSPA